eukprot:scaffold267259_cov15-Tisochrysis_lutea.AAC.1
MYAMTFSLPPCHAGAATPAQPAMRPNFSRFAFHSSNMARPGGSSDASWRQQPLQVQQPLPLKGPSIYKRGG